MAQNGKPLFFRKLFTIVFEFSHLDIMRAYVCNVQGGELRWCGAVLWLNERMDVAVGRGYFKCIILPMLNDE